MPMNEIPPLVLPEMAYTKKKAEAIITALETPLNTHLVKLAAVPSREVPHWKNEALAWLRQIAAIRLKPGNKPGTWQFYFRLLYDEPFGGAEVVNVASHLQLLQLQYGRLAPDLDAEQLSADLHSFHSEFAHGCAAGTMTPRAIAALVDQFMRGSPLNRAG